MAAGKINRPNAPSIVGAYLVNVTPETGQVSPRAIVSFSESGVVLSTASDVPNTTFIGQWKTDGHGRFVGTYLSFAFGPSDSFDGTAEIAIAGRVSRDRISGTYTAIGKTPDGGELFPPELGKFEGLRVRPQGGNL